MTIEIRVPTLGESVTEATVARWLKQPGETVARDEPIVELETDKVTLEVPAPAAGRLSDVLAAEGANVPVGAVLGTIADGATAAAPHPSPLPASGERERGGAARTTSAHAFPATRAARRASARSARDPGAHDPAAPPHRRAPEGGAEHRGDADHLQRDRHVGSNRAARALARQLREKARRPP